MKKSFVKAVTLCICLAVTFGVCACAGTLSQFTGVTMQDLTVVYDGQAHSLSVLGELPEGTYISYENNGKTEAGTHTVKATLSKEGYATKTLSATLQINKADYENIVFADASYMDTGSVRSLAVAGTLPEGTSVSYENNDKKEVGVYTVKATLTNPNYNTKTYEAVLTIKSKFDVALDIINGLLSKPDPWSFMPAALTPSRMAYDQMPIGGTDDFSSFVSVSQISKKSIGKQFNVLYEGLNDAASLLANIDTVYAVGNTIADAYQTYINKNPDSYAQFTGSAAGFNVRIVLDGNKSTLLAGNSAVSVELDYDGASMTRTGRIQLTDGAAVKYVSTPTALKFAVKMTVAGVGNVKQIEFARSGDAVAGYLREFTGTSDTNLKTTGVIISDAESTVIMSDKRESDDLKINGYEEVYSSVTGEMLGGRVLETVKLFDYDTLWLHLSDVSGFQSIRVVGERNVLNADTIYLNGQSESISTKSVSLLDPSRRYDIEMKEVWYVVKNTQGNKINYELKKTLIPMLFVQYAQTKTFEEDIKEKNTYLTSATLPSQKMESIDKRFTSVKALFDTARTEVSYNDIVSFIGNKSDLFTTSN